MITWPWDEWIESQGMGWKSRKLHFPAFSPVRIWSSIWHFARELSHWWLSTGELAFPTDSYSANEGCLFDVIYINYIMFSLAAGCTNKDRNKLIIAFPIPQHSQPYCWYLLESTCKNLIKLFIPDYINHYKNPQIARLSLIANILVLRLYTSISPHFPSRPCSQEFNQSFSKCPCSTFYLSLLSCFN